MTTVNVTQELIDQVVAEKLELKRTSIWYDTGKSCLIAVAIQQVEGDEEIRCAHQAAFKDFQNGIAQTKARLPKEVWSVIMDFDAGRYDNLKPFSFEIEWSDY
jgi:hypothetical protein